MRRLIPASRAERGFSLVELAVYVAILGLIAAILATVMVSLFRSQQTVRTITDVSSNAQNFTTVFDRDARNARSASPATGGPLSTITLQTASTSGSTPCYRNVVYTVQSGKVLRNGAAVFDLTITSGGFSVDGRTVGYSFTVQGVGDRTQAVQSTTMLAPPNTGGAMCAV